MKWLFWLVLYPLSLLPMCLLYLLSYLLYLILYYVVRYRRKVVTENLENSFPELSTREIARLRRRYYLHLSQIAVEMLKMLTIGKKVVGKRYRCVNPELINRYYEQGRSVILMSSHYNNWEWMILRLDEMFKHQGIGVGKPNSNKEFELLINQARTRRGTKVVFADTVRDTFEHYENEHIQAAYMMLSDQSPSNPKKSFVTTFLNQPSCMLFGAEYFAKKYNIPVVYYQVIKESLGYYRVELELITDDPQSTDYGFITKRYVALMEKTIRKRPEYWLWSHRRWKHKPELVNS